MVGAAGMENQRPKTNSMHPIGVALALIAHEVGHALKFFRIYVGSLLLAGDIMGTRPKTEYLERTAAAAQLYIKLVALANAGGVAATMTVIGATAKNGGFQNILALPLGLFALGVLSTIIYAANLYLRIAFYEQFEPDPLKWLVSDFTARCSGYASPGLFLFGCLTGVWIVACA